MGLFKYIVIGLMMISLGFGLGVEMPKNITLSEGETQDIRINISNHLSKSNVVGVTAYSEDFTFPIVLSTHILTMDRYSSTNITATINSKGTKPGDYTLTFLFASTQEDIVRSKIINVHIQQTIEIVPVYSYVKVTQGDFVTLKFTVYNYGKSTRSIIVDPESFPDDFNAEYPEPFYLNPDESKTIKVKVTVPLDYHSGLDTHKITVLSGEVTADSGEFDLSVLKRSEFKNVVNIAAVELGGYIGENGERGYNLLLRVDNRKDEAISGIELTGFPLGWNVSGDTPFYIGANSVKDINVRVIPKNLDEYKLDILLVKDSMVLSNTTLTFSGAKAGLVGAYFFGGSLTVGLLIVVLLALVLLYIRQRNMKSEEEEKSERLDYLKNLVDEVKKK